jgi:hypothetical protein
VRVQHQLGFNPYLWSGVLPFLHANDIMLNSPFMDQKITPLMPARGSDLLINQMHSPSEAERVINGNLDIPSMPTDMRGALLGRTQVLIWVGTPADVHEGLAPLTGSEAAATYDCTTQAWYLVCTKRQGL